jgi:uncharacterized cofD-like protein
MTPQSPKIVSIGGGCGATQVLLGLSQFTTALTGIIAVTDTGRSTGKVRTLANIPAPGDIRNALATLSGQSLLPELMQHRLQVSDFPALDGIAMGNLMIAAITQMTGSFGRAVELMQELLDVKIPILPVTTHNTHLCAELVDGTIVEQEFNVRALNKPAIKRVFIQNSEARAYEACVNALLAADLITIGPGSLFTTVLACLAFTDIAQAIRESKAVVVYICNTTTQPGQTDGYALSDHVREIVAYLGKDVLDYAVINATLPPGDVTKAYEADGVYILQPTPAEIDKIQEMGVEPMVRDVAEIPQSKRNLWQKQDSIRHDPEAISELLIRLVAKR